MTPRFRVITPFFICFSYRNEKRRRMAGSQLGREVPATWRRSHVEHGDPVRSLSRQHDKAYKGSFSVLVS
jgi:hypothetical protein